MNLRRFPTAADQLTLLRLLLIPPLWVLALLEMRLLLAVGVAIGGLTDVFDGWLARRLALSTRLGSQLDSIADMLLITSITIWLVLLRPDFFARYGAVLIAWALLGLLTLLVGWLRFRRVANLHLYSAKAAGFLGYLFVLYLLLFDTLYAPFFWIAIGAAFLGTVETLLVLLSRSRVDEHVRTILMRGSVDRAD